MIGSELNSSLLHTRLRERASTGHKIPEIAGRDQNFHCHSFTTVLYDQHNLLPGSHTDQVTLTRDSVANGCVIE